MSDNYSFSEDFQDLILACLVTFPEKFFAYGSILDAKYFVGVQATITARSLFKYHEQFNRFPSWEVLTELVSDECRRLESSDIKSAHEYVGKLRKLSTEDVDFVVSKVIDFARERATIAAVRKTIESIQTGKKLETSVVRLFEDALSIGTNLDDLGYVFHEDYGKVISKVTDRSYGISTGFPLLDSVWRNGWGPGWLVVPLAPPKRYKTTVSINLAMNMVGPTIGKNVFYYPCEITAELAFIRALQNLTGQTEQYLYENPAKFEELVKEQIRKIHGHLWWKFFPAGSATIADIRNHAKTVQKQFGIKPDAIFIDYAETVKTGSKSDLDHRQSADVYTEARALGAEFQCPIIMPDRCNRETVDRAVPDMRSFQGAFQKAGIVDAAIGLCATEEEYQQNILRFFIFLNRHGKALRHFRGKVDPETQQVSIDEEIEYNPEDTGKSDNYKTKGGGNRPKLGLPRDLEA